MIQIVQTVVELISLLLNDIIQQQQVIWYSFAMLCSIEIRRVPANYNNKNTCKDKNIHVHNN